MKRSINRSSRVQFQMALLQYLKPSNGLPDPRGFLSVSNSGGQVRKKNTVHALMSTDFMLSKTCGKHMYSPKKNIYDY